jgi:hypothetical protein
MNFLTPLAFALAALLPVIVALYILKLRREEETVASIYLWEDSVRDVAANAPWQRLHLNWLLLLQLLVLIGLILALARPFTWTVTTGGEHLILVVDTSASMGATDVEPDRLGAAVNRARGLARDLPPEVPVTLIEAGARVQVAISGSTDRGLLARTLNDLEAGTGEADMATALELAAAVAGGDSEAEIVLLSDGGGRVPDRLPAAGALRYLPIGTSAANQAISAISLDPGTAGQTPSAFARVTNYDDREVRRRLTLHARTGAAGSLDVGGGALVAARDLTLDPGGAVALTLPDLPAGTVAVEARLEGEDVLAIDDRAWAVAPVLTGAQIQIVGPGNRFLELALALLPEVEVTTISPEEYERTWAAPADAAADAGADAAAAWLTIFDTVVPEPGHYPPGALLFVGPLRATPFFSVTGTLAPAAPRAATAGDPLLAYVDLRNVVVQEAARVPLPDWGRPVIVAAAPSEAGAEADGDVRRRPLLITGEAGGRNLAVLTFDLRRSDLPLHPAFPILLSNLVHALAPGAAGPLPITLPPGQPVEIPLPPQAEAAVVTPPGAPPVRLPVDAGRPPAEAGRPLFDATGTPGVYEIAWEAGGETRALSRLAVNLFNPQESNVAPRQELAAAESGGHALTAERPARRPWWRPLAWAALILLVAEWLVQYRNNLAQLSYRRPGPPGSGRGGVRRTTP